MKKFNIPYYYKSSIISRLKEIRKEQDPRKRDFSPTLLDFGPIRFFIARHFGFCYGVENAIEISYKAVEENPNKRIFLISQMIHNPEVNNDIKNKGVQFIMNPEGKHFINWNDLTKNDIVIIPAFGTTLEIEKKLKDIGIEVKKYDTTCPFVERVWNKSEKLGKENYTIIIHGKHKHEETRATFSHSNKNAPSLMIKDFHEAKQLAAIIMGNKDTADFYSTFKGRYSKGFNPEKDLERVGVVNQTTMLANETQKIADYLKNVMIEKYGNNEAQQHFADTRDTLCYATNDNQEATYGLLKQDADLAIVVGGYNSSNTSHIVELCEQKLPTYYISSAEKIISNQAIKHYNFHIRTHLTTSPYLPNKEVVDIILTSGASCPDTLVEQILRKLLSYYANTRSIEEVLAEVGKENNQ